MEEAATEAAKEAEIEIKRQEMKIMEKVLK